MSADYTDFKECELVTLPIPFCAFVHKSDRALLVFSVACHLRSLPNESTVFNGEAASMDLYFKTYPTISPHGCKLGQIKQHRFEANIWFEKYNNFYSFSRSMIFFVRGTNGDDIDS